MLDKNETQASRSDALSAYESIFGDSAVEPTDAEAEDQDTKNNTGQDKEDSDAAERQARGDETGHPEELKVVMSIKGDGATIGVQRPSSDPHIESFDDPDLTGLAGELLAVLERARAGWEDSPRYPAYARPAPPTRRRSRREEGSAQDSAAEGEAAQQQPRMF